METSVPQPDLSSLIMKATNPLNNEDDPNLVQAVCREIGNDIDKIHLSIRLIIHKIQSPHKREAMQALLVLQACINNCGPKFHSEIGQFRFLNELVKLVSPKYSGNHTACEVKKRIIELLYTWTLDLKNEQKISEAFEMLKKQGVVKEEPNYLGTQLQPQSKIHQPASFEDEKNSRLLQQLLQSKRPEDFIKANALIKHMVKEDERSSRRTVEVETALNNVKVLDEMLTQYSESKCAKQADLDLMEELYSSCQTLRVNIYRIVSEMEDKEDGMGELLKASDELSRVMGKYKVEMEKKLEHSKTNTCGSSQSESKPVGEKAQENSLLDLSPDFQSQSQVLDTLGISSLQLNDVTHSEKPTRSNEIKEDNSPDVNKKNPTKHSILDELGDVFSNGSLLGPMGLPASGPSSTVLLSADTMPQPLSPEKNNHPIVGLTDMSESEKESSKPMLDLDLLSTCLLRESLPTHVDPMGPLFKMQEKVSLNEMKQRSKTLVNDAPAKKALLSPSPPSSVSEESVLSTSSSLEKDLVDTFLLGEAEPTQQKEKGLTNLQIGSSCLRRSVNTSSLAGVTDSAPLTSQPSASNAKLKGETTSSSAGPNVQLCEVKPLNNIHVALEDIKPGKQSSVSLIDSNGVSVVLHFTENQPRDDVSIIVVSVTSRSPHAISNYILQAVGPKGCKVRLQAPSSTTLAEYSPFLPPPAITQIMLIANPNQLNVSLKVMLSYTVNDESVTDLGEIGRLPL